jgi:hypothetical protein
MAVFKVPKITTSQREQLILASAEIVYDTTEGIYYGGNDNLQGGFPLGSGGGTSNVATITLSQQDIDNKKVTLSTEPFYPNAVSMTIVGGISQVNGIDFEVIGSDISWDGLGLDNFLEISDTLIIQY